MTEKFYKEFDRLFSSFVERLNEYKKSEILQDYFFERFESSFYATLIDIFFSNLTPKNLKEYELSTESENIKNTYRDALNDVNLIIHAKNEKKLKKIDLKYYNNFKARLGIDFPKLFNLMAQVEKEIDTNRSEIYLKCKKEEIKKSGRIDSDFYSEITTKIVEVTIKKKNRFPSDKEMDKSINGIVDHKLLPEIAQLYFESLKSHGKKFLTEQKGYREEFESFLYEDWAEPLSLLECLIRVSLESVEKHATGKVEISEMKFVAKNRPQTAQKVFIDDVKLNALIRIHDRALQITNEILTLLKAGYPNGANARWRSLHELAVISMFLSDNDNVVSQRYLEHEAIIRYKEVMTYQEHCEKLGQVPHKEEFLDKLKERRDELCDKYGKDYKGEWVGYQYTMSKQTCICLWNDIKGVVNIRELCMKNYI